MLYKFSKNTKLNGLLNEIADDLTECVGLDDVRRYVAEFPREIDHNIAQYGNLLIYHDDVRKFYRRNGYKCTEKMSNERLWETYRRQVGYVARAIIRG